IADRQDCLGGIIRNFNAEFFFERHDKLNGVEAVSAEIVDEAGLLCNLFGIDAKMLDNDFLDAFCSIAHVRTLNFRNFQSSLAAGLPLIKLKKKAGTRL